MDLDRDAKRILDLATEARAPAAGDKARVERRLAAVLGASALTISPTAASEAAQHASAAVASAKAASGFALKWWISSAVVASAVAGYVVLSNEPAAPNAAPRAPAPSAAPALEAAPVVEAPPAIATTDVPAPEQPARPLVPAKKRSAPSGLGEELELLHRAQAAWRAHDASDALGLLDEHRTRFPRSDLKLERDGLRVLTLCELGRKSEATSLAKKLLERAPRSPLRATIEESCALK
jgi:hypothetical protein